MRIHLDTDFLVHALSMPGRERQRFREVAEGVDVIEISSIVWYEFCRGPRTVEQIAVAKQLFGDEGIVPFTDLLAEAAADQFRRLGSPRRRAADVAIGVVARECGATLLTRNARDFAGIDRLEVEAFAGQR
jgi:predicted nucleic acid-binding protein